MRVDDVTVEVPSEGDDGVVVTYQATAVDAAGNSLDPVCVP